MIKRLLAKIEYHYHNGTLWNRIVENINWRGPFQARPLPTKKSYASTHQNKGLDYHKRFTELPGRSLAWSLEKKVIHQIADSMEGIRHLDFAGGTGRIAGVLEEKCTEQCILDVSAEMLSVARRNCKDAESICRDFRDGIPEMEKKRYDLVSAFRFFPNAEPALRDAAMEFISSKTRKAGILFLCSYATSRQQLRISQGKSRID